jgi:hypothetical protein
MSVKSMRLAFCLLLGVVSTGVARAADVTPQVYIDFVGSLNGTSYTLGPREIDKTGTFAAHHGTEIVAAGLGTLTDADQASQESFQIDAAAFNNNATTFAGTPFIVEAVFTATGASDSLAPIIDIGGQAFIRFQTGLSAGSWNGSTDNVNNNIQAIPNLGETHHYAIVYDGASTIDYYLDGVAIFRSTNGSPQQITKWVSWGNIRHVSVNGGRQLVGQYDAVAFSTFEGTFDPAADFLLPGGPGSVALAFDPQPAADAVDVLRNVVLSWSAGQFAATHDVYLGTSFADVNDATRGNPMGALVEQGQEDTTLNVGRLEFGQTYYWRVDEVNAAPDNTIYKGDVWSFTVEPYAYPLKVKAATASNAQPNMGPENTINGSGLNADGQHGTELTTMWMTTGAKPAWIQYEFDKVYLLNGLQVWNSNQQIEAFLGFGAKTVTIEYSTDGQTWTALENVPEFAKASGTTTYAANTTVDMAGVMAKFVRLTIEASWGGMPQTGLSEVQFYYVPLAAREPQPQSGEAHVLPYATLSWRAGRQAASHQVYFGTDAGNLSLVATADDPSFEPEMNLAQTYFWKVVEVNAAEAVPEWESDVWSFSTAAALVVDGFESYTNDMDAGKAIFQTWTDGYNVATNGSIVGHGEAPFAERTIVRTGMQSMPFSYDNSGGATISEATRTFDDAQDWTAYGSQILSIAFYGAADNAGTLYLKINNTKVPYSGEAANLQKAEWQQWTIDLASTGASLKNVTKLVIGVEGAGAAGTLFFDDIELSPTP